MESRGEDADLTNCLATELGGLESIIRTSITITDDFDAAVSAVGENLHNRADPEEIRGCVEAVLANSESIQSQLRELTSQLQESQANVEKLQAGFLESQKSLQTDPLTGVGNRRFFDLLMTQSIDAARTSQMSRILLLIDLDNFKHINDSYGHAAGDDVLRYVASKMQEIASDASIARYGGDEFAVFMNCEQPHDGLELANELHQCFVGKHLTKRGTGESLGNVTLSIGLALLRSEDTSESWFDRADKLLYSAKAGGRSCVMAERKLGLA
jgi:diguanylate cyclase